MRHCCRAGKTLPEQGVGWIRQTVSRQVAHLQFEQVAQIEQLEPLEKEFGSGSSRVL
jgi:hypothetical protein